MAGAAGRAAGGGGSTAGAGGSAAGAGGGAVGGSTGAGGTPVTCSPACNSTTQTCVGTKCLANDGQSCGLASQCASGACTPFYADADGDGYGAGSAAGFCGTTAPVGYATMTGDCCDDATHLAVAKLIHPGADYQTTSAGGVCNITWDYNCSGAVEKAFANLSGGCGSGAACVPAYTPYPDADCGLQESSAGCSLGGPGGPTACYTAGVTTALGCR
jgi:hypothetical protein